MIKFWIVETAKIKITLYSYQADDRRFALSQTIGAGPMAEEGSMFTHGPIMHGNRHYETTADVDAAAHDMIDAYRSMLNADGAYNVKIIDWA